MSLNARAHFKPSFLRASAVSLSRGGRVLVSEVGFEAASGDALVITGPNGSGKTTLLRAIAGFIMPDSGAITIEPGGDQAVAYMGHAEGLKPSESVGDALRFWAKLSEVDPLDVDVVMEQMAVAHLARRACGTLSAGQRRRTALARVALSRRAVWVLDEPTAPLDARSRERVAELIADHRKSGGIVIATTHADLGWPDAKRLELADRRVTL